MARPTARFSRSMSTRGGLARRLAPVPLAMGIATAALALTVSAASAHASYVRSTPAANAVLTSAPSTVSITFAQRLDPQGLMIAVYGHKGNIVSTGQAQISATDPKTATISMKGDDSDIYRVDWQTVSAEDGDPTLGAFVFAVDPSGKSDKVVTTTSVAPTSSGVPPLIAALIGVGGLILGGGGMYAFTRTRAR
jgi:methionine-rich copper-binding protein CopC